MRSVREGEMVAYLAVDVEAVRFVELPLIAVC
jgi:hypothetical protein